LLGVRRGELRAYLRAKKQKWREDVTNLDTTRMRAGIRKKLLPLLEKEFQSGVVEHLGSLAKFAREDQEFLELLARERCEALARKTGDETRIGVAGLVRPLGRGDFNTAGTESAKKKEKKEKKEDKEERTREETNKEERKEKFAALTKRMLRRLIEERKRGTGQITAQHIAAVMELARHGESGKLVQLPGGVDVRREREELVFCANSSRSGHRNGGKRGAGKVGGAEKSSGKEYEHKIDLRNGEAILRVSEAGCVIRVRVIDWSAQREETKESGAVLDRDRVRLPLVLRNWRFGDRLQPAGHQKAHKLKRLLNEKRVSRWERDGWPVLTSGGVLVWARGFPVAAGFAANEGTRTGILIAEENT